MMGFNVVNSRLCGVRVEVRADGRAEVKVKVRVRGREARYSNV